ncbi:MAG: Uma2 family endonuclease [Gemmatales bacterium]
MSATMIPAAKRATIDDLLRYDGKAELIDGKLVKYMAAGIRHSRIATMICVMLLQFEKATKLGYAFDDNLGYRVAELFSGRESFSPDVSFYVGQLSLKDKGFVEGPPTFAVEIRSPEEYGSAAEKAIAAKRADYFEAGTLVVWDVDPDAKTITSYRSDAATTPTVFKVGDTATAEPALSGWKLNVAEVLG